MESAKLSSGPAPSSPPGGHPPAMPSYAVSGDGTIDYIISDYMERLGTRLNILETELKYAWRALDLLSQEYIKMWERLEKLEGLLYEQQTVISQLIEYYATGGTSDGVCSVEDALVAQQSSVGELDAIAESLGAAIGIEETSVLREKLAQQELARLHGITQDSTGAVAAVTDMHRNVRNLDRETLETLEEEANTPDEAFYRSLNNAYREDLICGETSRPTSQLGMIWEEAEEAEDGNGKKDAADYVDRISLKEIASEDVTQSVETFGEKEEKQVVSVDEDEGDEDEGEIFSAADYKNYRGNTPCVSEQDLAQLSRLSTIDQVALEKLHELDRLTTKLQKDSQNLKELQSRLMDSPKHQYATEAEAKLAEESCSIDEQLRKIYAETDVDNWTYSRSPGSTGRSASRVSTDSGMATDAEFTTRSISPRVNAQRGNVDSTSSTYTPPRLSYTAALLEKSPEPVIPLPIDVGNFAKGYAENKELTDLMAESFATVTCASPTIYNTPTDKVTSPTLSAHSVHSVHSVQSLRTRQDGYFGSAARLNLEFSEGRTPPSPSPSSPPPPAPQDSGESFLMPGTDPRAPDSTEAKRAQSPSFQRTGDKITTLDQGRLSPRTPHSPKSPKISPKHAAKTNNANIVAAKSDSGLSSMSGWSSLDKSPGSPKSSINKMLTSYSVDHTRSNLIPTTQTLRASSPIPPLPEKTPIFTQEPLYDTPEGRDAFANSAMANAHSTTASLSTTINHLSAFTAVKSPCSSQDEYNFVPPPAPSSDNPCPSPKRRGQRQQTLHHTYDTVPTGTSADFVYRSEQPAIYSVAGSNRQQVITSVYTSGSGPYMSRTIDSDNYPEILEQYSNYPEDYNIHPYSASTITSSSHGKKPTRAMSYGDGMMNHEGYKNAMYRTMFPTGNITDALSYYPTSANLPRTESNDNSWLSSMEGQIPHDSTSSSIRSLTSDGSYAQSPYTDRRYPNPPAYQAQQYHAYANQMYPQNYMQQQQQHQQQQQQQHQQYGLILTHSESAQLVDGYQRQWQREHQYLQDIDAPSISGMDQQHSQQGDYYDTSGVIVSQSGYISISADIKEHEEPKLTKKVRRGASLKSAMNSMSSWLPDLHLSKRNRSQSLPGGVRREDLDGVPPEGIPQQQPPPETSARGRGRAGQVTRKKKKHNLVSTVSGILQKAKRRGHQASSMSDPEQSETEWSSGRQSGMSEDEDSALSDATQDTAFFAKVKSSGRRKQQNQQVQQVQQQQQQAQQLHQQQQQTMLQQQTLLQQKELMQQQQNIQQQQQILQQQIQQHQEQLQQQVAQENVVKERRPDGSEPEFSDNVAGEEEASGKSTGSGSGGSSIFATVGDIKRSAGSSDEAPNEKAPKLPPVTLMGGASMEFAVSRALGKYRQRQSSTVSDEQMSNDDIGADKKSDDGLIQPLDTNFEYAEETVSEKEGKPSVAKPPELVTSISEEAPPSEGSPSASSLRGHAASGSRFLPRHQQSLEIPWGRSGEADEDNRSTHSYRSTSRVSSRRQSTEDSIDSEDEWYCYELRKLEELERQSQMEPEMGVIREPDETEPFQPDEDVKERMSFVLRELRLKAQPKEEVLSKEEYARNARMNGTMREMNHEREREMERSRDRDERPIPKRKTAESVESVFARVTDYHTWAHEEEARREERMEPPEEGSSGETSGPDSPGHSMDEDEDEMPNEEQSRRSSSGSTLRHGEKHLPGSNSLSREGSVSVPPSEVSVSIPGGWDSESTVLEGDREDAGSEETGTTATLSLPKIKIDSSSCGSSDTTLKEGQASPGPPASKWKLLKALKERKAEEKLKEVEDAKTQETPVTHPPTAVSIMIK